MRNLILITISSLFLLHATACSDYSYENEEHAAESAAEPAPTSDSGNSSSIAVEEEIEVETVPAPAPAIPSPTARPTPVIRPESRSGRYPASANGHNNSPRMETAAPVPAGEFELEEEESMGFSEELLERSPAVPAAASVDRELPGEDQPPEKYKIEVKVEDNIRFPSDGGFLIVTVGSEDMESQPLNGFTSAVDSVRKYTKYVKVVPHTNRPEDLFFSPASVCMEVIAEGSDAHFSMMPKDWGEFSVSVLIEQHGKKDCSGIAKPRGSKVLSVKVNIDWLRTIIDAARVAWEKFWYAILAFIATTLILVFRQSIFRLLEKAGFKVHKKN